MPTSASSKGYLVSSIHQGPGDLWIIPGGIADSAAPQLVLDLPSGTPDATTYPSAVCLGTTESGITFTIKEKFNDIAADQFDAPIDTYKEESSGMLEAELSQQSVDLLQQALSTGVYATVASPGYKQLTFGGVSIVPTICLAAITPKRTGTNLYIVSILFKAYSKGGLEVLMQRKKKSTHKVQFAGQADITRTAGRQIGVHYETI